MFVLRTKKEKIQFIMSWHDQCDFLILFSFYSILKEMVKVSAPRRMSYLFQSSKVVVKGHLLRIISTKMGTVRTFQFMAESISLF